METLNSSRLDLNVACSKNINLLLIDSNNRFIHDDKTRSITPHQSVHFTLPSRNTPEKKILIKSSRTEVKAFT